MVAATRVPKIRKPHNPNKKLAPWEVYNIIVVVLNTSRAIDKHSRALTYEFQQIYSQWQESKKDSNFELVSSKEV